MKRTPKHPVNEPEVKTAHKTVPVYQTNEAAFHAAYDALRAAKTLIKEGKLRAALDALRAGKVRQPEGALLQKIAYVLSGGRLGFDGGYCEGPDGKKHYTLGFDPPINPEAWHGPN